QSMCGPAGIQDRRMFLLYSPPDKDTSRLVHSSTAAQSKGLAAKGRGQGLRLKLLTWLETNSLAGRYMSDLAGAGITADASLARLDHEHAKAAQFDPFTTLQSHLHRFKQGLDRDLSLGLWHACLLRHLVNYVELDHFEPPFSPTWPSPSQTKLRSPGFLKGCHYRFDLNFLSR